MTNSLYSYIFQFWSGLFFESPMLDNNFYNSLTTITIFVLILFVVVIIYKVAKVFFGGNRQWF